jgi:hypothetical protein
MIAAHTPTLPLHSRLQATVSRPTRLWAVARAVLAVVALCLVTLSARAETLTLASSYKATGKNGDGSSYTGTVTVKVISDTTYTIEWKVGDTVTKGFGMRMGDTLSATYTLDGQPGLIIYKVQDDGTLSGIWAIKGESGTGSEVLTPR